MYVYILHTYIYIPVIIGALEKWFQQIPEITSEISI